MRCPLLVMSTGRFWVRRFLQIWVVRTYKIPFGPPVVAPLCTPYLRLSAYFLGSSWLGYLTKNPCM